MKKREAYLKEPHLDAYLKSGGMPEYVLEQERGYLDETYLVYLVDRHGKRNESLLSPKKVYAAGVGIRELFTGFQDKGCSSENYMYLIIETLEPRYVQEDRNKVDLGS